jgi:hypothetical protein
MNLIEQYEQRLKEGSTNSTINQFKSSSMQMLEQELIKKTQDITQLISQNL